MTVTFYVLAAITITGIAAAMSLKNLVHCVLALTLGFVGLAALYLQLGAQFVGFTQILVYIGAVAILAMFAIMMTRGARQEAPRTGAQKTEPHTASTSRVSGALIAGVVFVVLAWAILSGSRLLHIATLRPEASVNQIGVALMSRYVLPLEIIGVLLTAALIGAGILAMDETRRAR